MNIILKLVKLLFDDGDTRKQVGLERKNYMVTTPIVPSEPVMFVPIECALGVDDAGLFNLLLMLHFGQSMEVTIYVRQLLVFFHGGYMWLDRSYPVDVNLISQITGLPRQGDDPAAYLCVNMDTTKMK